MQCLHQNLLCKTKGQRWTAEILPLVWILTLGVLSQVKSIIAFLWHINFCIKYSIKNTVFIIQIVCSAIVVWTASIYFLHAERSRVCRFHTTVYCCQPNSCRLVLMFHSYVFVSLNCYSSGRQTVSQWEQWLLILVLNLHCYGPDVNEYGQKVNTGSSCDARVPAWLLFARYLSVFHPFLLQILPSLLLSRREERRIHLRTVYFLPVSFCTPSFPCLIHLASV